MPRSTRRLPAALLLVAALLAAPALSGCAGLPIPGADGGGSDGHSGSGSGSGDSIGMSLPADFPSEVPLVEGEIKLGTKATDTSWMVTMVVPDESALDEADQLLADAGFTEVSEDTHTWQNGSYNVVISSASTDAGFTLNYIVSAA